MPGEWGGERKTDGVYIKIPFLGEVNGGKADGTREEKKLKWFYFLSSFSYPLLHLSPPPQT